MRGPLVKVTTCLRQALLLGVLLPSGSAACERYTEKNQCPRERRPSCFAPIADVRCRKAAGSAPTAVPRFPMLRPLPRVLLVRQAPGMLGAIPPRHSPLCNRLPRNRRSRPHLSSRRLVPAVAMIRGTSPEGSSLSAPRSPQLQSSPWALRSPGTVAAMEHRPRPGAPQRTTGQMVAPRARRR